MTLPSSSPSVLPQHRDHSRSFEAYRFVYPVLSRRSKGLSLGVNLNPDKVCNFDCIYCQVDRTRPGETSFVEMDRLLAELREGLQLIASGEIYQLPQFSAVPPELRRLNDIAFSGDGEPTTYRNFDDIIDRCAAIKRELGLHDTKLVLITNASMFHRPHVRRGLALLDANQGEIWGKLDAGTAEYFQQIDRTTISFERILENLADAARVRPIVIQSLFMHVRGAAPSAEELQAYCSRLLAIGEQGGSIRLVQVYTVARQPAESFVTPLSDQQMDQITELLRQQTGLACETYYGK